MNNRPLKQWQEKFANGEFNNPDFNTQVSAGWYDWFCKDSALANKTKKMGNIIRQITDSARIDRNNLYVFFKNSCPVSYPLYDQFKFCDITSGDVVYCINLNCGFDKVNYAVYGKENKFQEPLFKCRTSTELIKWFNQEITV